MGAEFPGLELSSGGAGHNCSLDISNTAAVIVAKICCVEAENIVVGADASLRNLAVVAEQSRAGLIALKCGAVTILPGN